MQPASKRTGKAPRSLLFLLLLGLAIHLLLPQITTLEHSLRVIRRMTWWAVGLAAGAQVVSYLGSGVLLPAIAACGPRATATPGAGLPNPASVFCEEEGYRFEIRTAADGSQQGFCVFPDGSECDEWAFYRGECAPAMPKP